MYRKRSKFRLVALLALLMVFQIVGPAAQGIYAAMEEGNFRIVHEDLKGGIAYLDWELDLDLEEKVGEYQYKGKFALESEVEENLIADNGEKVGTYTITTQGKLIVNIDQNLYKNLEKRPAEPEEDKDPVPGDGGTKIPGDTDEAEETEEPEDREDLEDPKEARDETTTDPENPEETKEVEDLEGERNQDDTQKPDDPQDEVKDTQAQDSKEDQGEGDSTSPANSKSEDEEPDHPEGPQDKPNQATVASSASRSAIKTQTFFTGTIEVPGAKEKEGLLDAMANALLGILSGGTEKEGVEIESIEVYDECPGFCDEGNFEKRGLRVDDAGVRIDVGDDVAIIYDWNLPKTHNYEAGDTYSFKIPREFEISSALTGDLDGEIGTYSVSPRWHCHLYLQ